MTTDHISDLERRHLKRHPRPVNGCMVCDARHTYDQVIKQWAAKQIFEYDGTIN